MFMLFPCPADLQTKRLAVSGACSPLQVPAGQPASGTVHRNIQIGDSIQKSKTKRARSFGQGWSVKGNGRALGPGFSHLVANERRPSDKTSTLIPSLTLDAVNPVTGPICRGSPTPIGHLKSSRHAHDRFRTPSCQLASKRGFSESPGHDATILSAFFTPTLSTYSLREVTVLTVMEWICTSDREGYQWA